MGENVKASFNANDNICSRGMNVPHTTNSNRAVLDKESSNPKTDSNAKKNLKQIQRLRLNQMQYNV